MNGIYVGVASKFRWRKQNCKKLLIMLRKYGDYARSGETGDGKKKDSQTDSDRKRHGRFLQSNKLLILSP